jgi:amino acid permease
VAEAAFGRPGKIAVDVFLVLSQTGFCVAYVIFIYKNLPLVDHQASIGAHVERAIVLFVILFQVCRPAYASFSRRSAVPHGRETISLQPLTA